MKLSPLARRLRTLRFVRTAHASASLYLRGFPFDDSMEEPPGTIEPWQAVAPVRPDTAFVRSVRFLDAIGEAFAAILLIVGGSVLIGLASMVGGAG